MLPSTGVATGVATVANRRRSVTDENQRTTDSIVDKDKSVNGKVYDCFEEEKDKVDGWKAVESMM